MLYSSAFDPATPGIPEKAWRTALAQYPEWSPPAGPLLVVSPHPDDEILGSGGLIHYWAERGREVKVISVTDGEAAHPDWGGLDAVRRDELQAALKELSDAPIEVVRLAIPDGEVKSHTRRLKEAVVCLSSASTTVIAPFERDGHPDHDAAGEACRDLARAHGFSIARYPVWTWHHTQPSSLERLNCHRFPLTVPAQRAKARALQCYVSQTRPYRGSAIVPEHVMTYFERPYEVYFL